MAVTVADIATTLLRATPADESTEAKAWAMWIEDARRQIKRRLGDLDDLDQDDLDYVVREAVALKAKRPDSATRVEISDDDGSIAKTYASGSGQVTILGEWWDLLTPEPNDRESWTINPVRPRC